MGGKRRGEPAVVERPPGHRRAIAVSALGALLCLVVWVGLVIVAIRSGQDWRDGSSIALVWLILATIAAIVALFGTFALVGRSLRAIGVLPALEPRAPRSRGGKRAAR
ncbi:hypothetical protein BH09ACT11_BH09ACT11_12130 [soil metagenome]